MLLLRKMGVDHIALPNFDLMEGVPGETAWMIAVDDALFLFDGYERFLGTYNREAQFYTERLDFESY